MAGTNCARAKRGGPAADAVADAVARELVEDGGGLGVENHGELIERDSFAGSLIGTSFDTELAEHCDFRALVERAVALRCSRLAAT